MVVGWVGLVAAVVAAVVVVVVVVEEEEEEAAAKERKEESGEDGGDASSDDEDEDDDDMIGGYVVVCGWVVRGSGSLHLLLFHVFQLYRCESRNQDIKTTFPRLGMDQEPSCFFLNPLLFTWGISLVD
jgi:hypothetical protein